jgi:hypothetical protein
MVHCWAYTKATVTRREQYGRIKNSETELAPEKAFWLDVRTIARVEVTSEDWHYPIESAFDETDERAELPHAELPQHVGALVPTTPDEQCPYPSYRHALLDLLRSLTDLLVGTRSPTSPIRPPTVLRRSAYLSSVPSAAHLYRGGECAYSDV